MKKRKLFEEENDGWILVDESLPKKYEHVRVTIWCEHEWIGFYDGNKWFVYGSEGLAEATVLAWQPTSPYLLKGKENEKS